MKRKSSFTSTPIRKPYQAKIARGSITNPRQSRRDCCKPEYKTQGDSDVVVPGASGLGIAFTNPIQICGLAVGAGPGNRVGRKVQMKSLEIRGNTTWASGPTQPVRIMVVYDKQFNATMPGSAAICSNFLAMKSVQNVDRFITIIDEIVIPYSADVNAGSPFHFYRKLNLEANYTGDIALDCNSGALLFIQADSTSVICTVTFSARMRFTDV